MNPLLIALAAEALAPAARAFAQAFAKSEEAVEDLESEGPGAEDIVALRQEWGYKLLAEQTKVEQLEQERDELRDELRRMTTTLRKVYAADQLMREAIYGYGSDG